MAHCVKLCLVLTVARLSHALPGLRRLLGPSILKPLPSLVWDKDPSPGQTIDGWLTAPMNPFDVEGPNVTLRTRCTFASIQPARLGTLFVHCGGPSSGKECVDTLGVSNVNEFDPQLSEAYNIFAIDQRGIHESLPKISCDAAAAAFHLPPLDKAAYELQDFTACPCSQLPVADAAVHHLPVGSDDDKAILERYKNLARRAAKCYLSQEGKLGNYNFFEYMGTDYLAYDLDHFRRAIGAERLSLFGGSYGSQVCSVYASKFPHRVGKMIIDSNTNPMQTLKQWVEDYADNHLQMFAEMARRCRAMGAKCALKNPLEDFDAALAKLSSGFFTAHTDLGTIKLTPAFLTGKMQLLLQNQRGGHQWFIFVDKVAQVLSATDGANFTANHLDLHCRVMVPATEAASCKDRVGNSLVVLNSDDSTSIFCPTWRQYGVCVSNDDGSGVTASISGAIQAQDDPGRYLPGQYAKYHAYVVNKYGPVGAAPALAMAASAFWPARVAYPGVGNADLRPLILGVTKDPQTPFFWTQKMIQAFPNSHLMTWQGYHHIMAVSLFMRLDNISSLGNATGIGIKLCIMSEKHYLLTGELPENGRVCQQPRLDLPEMEQFP